MFQKRNKIILLLLVVALLVGLLIWWSVSQVTTKKLSLQCEDNISKNNISPYSVCLISKNHKKITQLKNEAELNTKIFPSSSFIISLNLHKILDLYNVSHYSSAPKPNGGNLTKKSFCFVFYPIPLITIAGNGQESYNQIQNFYKEFKIIPTTTNNIGFSTDKTLPNIICTNPVSFSPTISFALTLPNSNTFLPFLLSMSHRGNNTNLDSLLDLKQYGVKVLLANSQFVSGIQNSPDNFRKILENNYSQMKPLTIIRYNINNTYYNK